MISTYVLNSSKIYIFDNVSILVSKEEIMGSLISGAGKAVWWVVATFFTSIIWAFTAPFTIMMLDDAAHSLKEWYK
tara:strand:+ start:375 stop:602 length:228 start_codon:yes stop_codon:yes gene_type:complete